MDMHVRLVGQRDLSGQIYRQLRAAILGERLQSGMRLPPSRHLAQTLKVSRKTVTEAYDQLTSEGFLSGRVGDGTYVAEHACNRRWVEPALESSSPLVPIGYWRQLPPMIDTIIETATQPSPLRHHFKIGVPDVASFPFVIWRRLAARDVYVQGKSPARYGDPRGIEALRGAIAQTIGFSRSVRCDAGSVMITNGAQHAFDLLARVMVEPGTVVAVEEPGYPLARACFASHGAKVVAVPVDAEGIMVDRLPESSRMVYVTPSHQFPLGMPMSLGRRSALLDWAAHHRTLVIEDDYDAEFRFDGRPLESLQNLDRHGLVAYVGTFSKTLFPALRMGFIVAPAGLREALVKARWLSDCHSARLSQAVLARFIQEGHFAKHVRRMQRVYAARRRQLLDGLHHRFGDWLEPIESVAGIHLTARLKRGLSPAALVARARDAGVGIHPPFSLGSGGPRTISFGFGAIGERDIGAGLDELVKVFRTMEYPGRRGQH